MGQIAMKSAADTGANSHVTPDLEAMENSEAYYGDDALHVGNGKGLPIHVPEISHNLLSVQKFCHDNDVFFEFHTFYFVVKDESTHTTLLTGPSKHGLYTITLPQLKSINKGPAPLLSFEVHRYFMLCVDHHSRYMWICHLAQKSDVYFTLKSFVQMVERIIHRQSCPHTSEQNGFVECRNRHVVETGLTLLAQACVPQCFWHYAFDTAVYLINRMPSRTSTNKLPFEHIFKRSPDYSFLRVFSPSHHGYRCLDISTERLYIARHPSPVSAISIPTLPPPLIIRQHFANLHQNPKQRVPYNPSANHATVLPTTITEPTSFTAANNSPKWRQAMKEEYDALIKNRTWSLVPRPFNTNVVDGKLIYRLKRDGNGAITCYKARFVAKGFRQQPGIDFHETFSPVVKLTTIRAVLLLAVTNTWPLHQLDVQNAFLHGNIKEQALRAWFKRLSKALFDLSFKGSKTDPYLFIYSRGHTLMYILDLGPVNYFLGIEIVPHVSAILLSQEKYILELLQSACLSNCKPVSSLMVTSSSLSLDDSTAFSNPVKYRQVVGSLQYVTISQPDIAFAVNKVSQYMHSPTENHWSTIKRILRYLHGNPDTSLEAFLDADWARDWVGDSNDRWSTGGFVIYLGSNLISWTAHKQRTVSKAEYKALADIVDELTWLQALLNELGIRSSSTPILWCDNLDATYLSANPIFLARTKHVEIDYHFVRETFSQGDLRVLHISTHDQIAYIFTKPLPTPRFLFLRSKL
ncbi:putative RNA-directed DNA polymerase [Tanacetum coccineum]